MKKNKSFAAKVVKIIVLLMSLCMILFMAFSYIVIRKTVTNQMKNDGTTLISTLKREILSYNINNLEEMYKIFYKMKAESAGNIVYISLSDKNFKIIVSDKGGEKSNLWNSNNNDAVSSASKKVTTENNVVNQGKTTGTMLKTANSQKVYNISTPLTDGSDVIGTLNIGLSLKYMYQQITKAILYILGIGIVIVAVTSFIGIITTKSLGKSLKNTIEKLFLLSKGDFTVQFSDNSDDEFSKLNSALGLCVETLNDTIGKTKGAVINLDNISSKLTTYSEEVSASTENTSNKMNNIAQVIVLQKDTVSNINSILNEFNITLDEMQVKAKDVSNSNNKIMETSDIGEGKLDELIEAINDVTESFTAATSGISLLNEAVSKISEITDVINDVAEQTNLLSLNAAIEASRAGDAGRGFAVVAEEIKKLAEKVIESSKSINSLIGAMKNTANEVTQNNKEISHKVSSEKQYIKDTVKSFSNIRTEVDKSICQIELLLNSVNKISGSKESIMTGISSVESVSNEITKAEQEISISIEEQNESVQHFIELSQNIKDMSEELREGVSKFKV